MRTLGLLFLAAATLAAEERSRQTYDVSALTIDHHDFTGPNIGFAAATGVGPVFSDSELEGSWISIDDIAESIRSIDPESWEDERNRIEEGEGVLTISQTKSNHDRIRQYLALLRGRLYRTVTVEADVLLLAPGVMEDMRLSAGLLTDDQVKSLRAAAADPKRGGSAGTLRAVATNRQRVHAAALTTQSFVREYDLEVASSAAVSDPIVGALRNGLVLDVRPVIAHDNATVVLEIRFASNELVGISSFDPASAPNGLIDQPETGISQARTVVTLPPGRTVLLSSSSLGRGPKPGWQSALLIRAAIHSDPEPADVPEKDARVLRAYDISVLTMPVRDFPGPRLGIPEHEAVLTGTTFVLEENTSIQVDPETLIDLLRANVAPDSWENAKNRAWISAGQLFISNSPEAQKSARAFLDSLASARARLISVEGWLVSLDESAWRAREKDFSGMEVPDDAFASLLADAAQGESSRVIASVQALGTNGARFHAARGTERLVVNDMDVEIAVKSSGYDPVVEAVSQGISLDVVPTLVGDGKTIQLDLRPSVVVGREPAEYLLKTPQGGRIQTISMSDLSLNTQTLVLEGKPTLVGMTTRAGADGKREILVFVVKATVVEAK